MALKWISKVQKFVNSEYIYEVLQDGETLINLPIPYVQGIGMILVHLNGVLQKHEYSETSSSSITFQPDYLREGSTIEIYYIPGSLSLGDIRIVQNNTDLSLLTDNFLNEVAIAINTRKFYIYTSSGWEEFVIPFTTHNVGILMKSETQPIVPNQEDYILDTFVYDVGSNSLMVFIDGNKYDNFIETSNNTVSFAGGIEGNEVQFVYFNQDLWEDSFESTKICEYNTLGYLIEENTLVNQNIVLSISYEYDDENRVTKEVKVKGTKTITRTFTYNELGDVETIVTTIQ